GVLRAFYNMCSHRGNQVAVDEKGCTKGFKCLFHGWTYDTEGQLSSVPALEKFSTVDKAENGLKPIHMDVWGGFVHLCLADEPPCSLAEFMQPMTERLGQHFGDQPWYLDTHLFCDVDCNWKLPYDAVSEFYHFNALHPKSIGGGMSLKDAIPTIYPNKAGVVGHFDAYYSPTEVFLDPTPIQHMTAELGASGVHTKSDNIEVKTRYPDAINLEDKPDWAVDMYVTLPHVAYLIQEQSVAVQRSWPIAVDRCHVELEIWTLTPPPRNFSEQFNSSSVKSRLVDILVEDFSTLERIQANLVHGAVRSFHFNSDEWLVKGLQDLIQVWIDREKAKGG
ncbi:MAG: Rieske 2Fe-2S domain-containing protein, partial [Gammaproteobacteria bacterium]|nr:Rieske 2Fe-2S domain-containing protein [Gammaproteobacteria bacterium]